NLNVASIIGRLLVPAVAGELLRGNIIVDRGTHVNKDASIWISERPRSGRRRRASRWRTSPRQRVSPTTGFDVHGSIRRRVTPTARRRLGGKPRSRSSHESGPGLFSTSPPSS